MVLLVCCAQAEVFDFNPNCRKAYNAIMALRLNEGRALLAQEEKQNPKNLIPVYLENYLDFITVYTTDTRETYEKLKSNKDLRMEMLRAGVLDCAILADPFVDTNLAVAPLYEEPFMIAVPRSHPMAERDAINAEELKRETMLLLGSGHCFRDHVLEVCPEFARFSSDAEGIRKSFEGSSLETIKYMVAAGMGVTVVPRLSVPPEPHPYIKFIPFEGHPPTRRVVLVWRRSFTRYEAIAALRNAVYDCPLEGVTRLSE